MMNITQQEFESFAFENDSFSDMDMCYNPETEEYDIYAIEWEGFTGHRYWEKFKNEDLMNNALAMYDIKLEAWVKQFRIKEEEKYQLSKKRLLDIHANKTIGGKYPNLMDVVLG